MKQAYISGLAEYWLYPLHFKTVLCRFCESLKDIGFTEVFLAIDGLNKPELPLMLAQSKNPDAVSFDTPARLENGKVYPLDNPEALIEAQSFYARQSIIRLMNLGVQFTSTDGVLIADEVEIGKGTVIWNGCVISGKTVIGEACEIRPYTVITDSRIENDCIVGPFTHFRTDTVLKSKAKAGAFVETKNTILGSNSALSHFNYAGDAEIGAGVNMGCGSITVNYDGKNKHKTIVCDDAFIGSNANLVAPVSIGRGAFVAAGSTVNHDVPPEALAIARARQSNKEGYALKLRGTNEERE